MRVPVKRCDFRRYSKFKELHQALSNQDIELPAPPPKRVFKGRPEVLEERISGLTKLLDAVRTSTSLPSELGASDPAWSWTFQLEDGCILRV